eukprot:g21305.t1
MSYYLNRAQPFAVSFGVQPTPLRYAPVTTYLSLEKIISHPSCDLSPNSTVSDGCSLVEPPHRGSAWPKQATKYKETEINEEQRFASADEDNFTFKQINDYLEAESRRKTNFPLS